MPRLNVIDMYHEDDHEAIPDFVALKNYGIIGIAHKASQGRGMRDGKYAARKAAALAAGLPWIAYHFLDNTDPKAQAANFMTAEPDPMIPRAMDYEKSGSTPNFSTLRAFAAELPKPAILYGGDLVRETVVPSIGYNRAWVETLLLWLAEYGPHERIPWPWSKAWLWQFEETGRVPLIGNVDGNFYDGSADQLAADLKALVS